ncbi:hypothetical protein B0H11DRAFT_2225467 [Mycena galericulata]|nr:hypothetical protein B0H11DRAFT_2225467 [Mycena galericulata]
MGRKVTGKAPGRTSDFSGEKKAWLEGFRDLLVEAGSDPGPVYTDVTNLFLLRYGFDLPFSENVDGKPEDNPPPADVEKPTPEEKARRDEIRTKLRVKLANWYRNRYKGKKVHAASIKQILSSMQSMSGPGARPRRKPAIAMYSKLYYATRIKAEFDAKWATEKETVPQSHRATMSQDYVRACWAKEDADFKTKVEDEAEKVYEAELKEWRAKRAIPVQSAENYNAALENLNEVGIPMADALAERLGAQVIILVVGPVGSEQGEVCLRTVFSDTSNTATPRTWAQFDNKGFTAMEASITRYGRAAFTRAECKARAWPPLEGAAAVPPPPQDLLSFNNDAPATGAMATATSPAAPAASGAATSSTIPPVTPPAAPSLSAVPQVSSASGGSSLEAATTFDELIPLDGLPTPNDGIDRTDWAECLIDAHAYLSRKEWGEEWRAFVKSLVEHEWSHYHNEENGKLPKGKSRPAEFTQWMKEHRQLIDYRVGDDFGSRLLEWWKELGPKTRWVGVGDGEGEAKEPLRDRQRFWCGDWERLRCSGRNGPMLVFLGLAWWGQTLWNAGSTAGLGGGDAALAGAADWHFLIRDVHWVVQEELTQGRAAMDEYEADREAGGGQDSDQEAEGEQAALEKGKTKAAPAGPKGKGKGKKTPVGKTAVTKPSAGKKRKRATGGSESESEGPPAVKAKTVPVRPKPRPIAKESALARVALGVGTRTRGRAALAEMLTAPAPVENGTAIASVASANIPPVASEAAVDAGKTVISSENTASGDTQKKITATSTSLAAGVEGSENSTFTLAAGTVPMDVDQPDGNGEPSHMRADAQLPPEEAKAVDPLENDPFADLAGLTAEELAEINDDPDADDDDDE